jgi:nucleoside 2-deoxyribosyltransferase
MTYQGPSPELRNVYVAASFNTAAGVRALRDNLQDYVNITSSWCEEVPLMPDDYREQPQEARFRANEDYLDIERSDIVAVFTGVDSTTGGLHVELGVAIALKKRIIVVGPRGNVFHYMNVVEHYPDVESFANRMEYEHNEGLY